LNELLLIRHAQSLANAGYSREADCPLTEAGMHQARRLASRLQNFDLSGFIALTSPYRRAAQTAAQITLSAGLRFDPEPAVREWGESTTIDGIHYPAESGDELIERGRQFLADFPGRKVIAVSHAAPIAVLTQLAWGETPIVEGNFWASVPNCCIRWLRITR